MRDAEYERALDYLVQCSVKSTSASTTGDEDATGKHMNDDDDGDGVTLKCLDMHGAIAFNRGEFETALRIWHQISASSSVYLAPADVKLSYRNKEGEVLHQLGQYEEASQVFQSAIDDASKHVDHNDDDDKQGILKALPSLHYNLGVAKRSLGKSEDALKVCVSQRLSLSLSLSLFL
jgi:tetratricopeptide (TPR) repeat protein